MLDLKKSEALIILGGLVTFLILIDSQCFNANDACLPDVGFVTTGPNVVSDDKILLDGLSHGYISPEWKEKLGEVYVVIASKTLTGNYHTFPLISSIGLLLMTYMFAYKITSNRLASVVGVGVLAFCKNFMWYSESLAYPTTWVVFFLIALYPWSRTWYRPLSFVISFILKAQALAMVPLLFVKEEKKLNKISYLGIAAVSIAIAVAFNWIRFYGSIHWSVLEYPAIGLYVLVADMWLLYALTPVVILLGMLWKRKVPWAKFLLISMGYMCLFTYLLPVFSTYNAFGYRMLPFEVFFALGVSLIIANYKLIIKKQSRLEMEAMHYVSG